MAKPSVIISLLKTLMIFICIGWVSLWILKPTNSWTRAWRQAEESADNTLFGYYGLNFAVLSFPLISLAMVGLVYLSLLTHHTRSGKAKSWASSFSNPVIINSFVGLISCLEILAVSLFILFLAWTFYARISNDFKKLTPVKSMKLDLWQVKYLRVATRFGLLAEACLALLLLPVLRGLSVFRLLGVQLEASVRYHKWLGTAMIFFASAHGGSTLFIWGTSHYIQDEVWRWQKTGRIYLAGEFALAAGLVMWITSLSQIRRKNFELFYYTHHLYIVFLVFFLFHAGDRHFYWVFPGIFLFGLDKLLRIIQSRSETRVLAARLFPCNAVELVLPKDPGLKYAPTSILFIKIPEISRFEWHPFSITSSSMVDEHTVSGTIKSEGKWTRSLYNLIQAALDSSDTDQKFIPLKVEGPYGPPSVDFLRYKNLLLVAGGVGITPFLSILQEVSCETSYSRYRSFSSSRIQLIFIVKSSQDITMLTPISSLLLNPKPENFHLILKVFVTREKHSSETPREILAESSASSKSQTVNFGKECSNYQILGPESLRLMSVLVGISSVVFFVVLIALNHIFDPSREKKVGSMKSAAAASAMKGDHKVKGPSWAFDLLIVASYMTAVAGSSLVVMILRWRRQNKNVGSVSTKEAKALERSSVESTGVVEEHEIRFGGRPDFEEIFSEFQNECEPSDTGVLVCGPESMKQSVASMCRKKSLSFCSDAKRTRPKFHFHSLNFNL